MLDIKQIRENPQAVQERLQRRGDYDLQPLLELDRQQRDLEQARSQLQARSNEIGKLVGQKIKSGSSPDSPEVQDLREEGNTIKTRLSELEPQERELKEQIETFLLTIPNLPSDSTPIGKNEAENIEVRRWGDEYLPQNANILPHWEIGEKLGLLNFERSTKIAQSRFVSLIGIGAQLERALIQFMLDRQTAAGYVEIIPPFLINSQSLTASGQLPKFAEESFKCANDDLWLSPTAEVPIANLYRGEILAAEDLPIYYCAHTPCFRREAGSYGRDTRGLIRLHQFNKVELFKFVHPDTSEQEHQKLLHDAEAILQALQLPYRVLELCTGDLGFSSTKTYDLEVWLPSSEKYREISSCSNCMDFQARRGSIRFKEAGKKGTQYVHTLNGSGLAVGRTMAAILENYQQSDGTVKVPEVLQPYLRREVIGEG
ncbi:MAG: Serine--tRNA ligase [Chroococcidiopsis sp. SAG 2025]|uniref:serine--tRNA ligase n=1 Tax=Chroococcidiopsis sp. SAG 2025 TaxID=171389 RepID=UPI0029374522|nr:serine--tRNA ligase [Chroococcidiopsis sp. SAG 2025]MDV2991050.1 Serine--tRNA ligase [Chroococcidiopsis sp. SAG 2025]